MTAPTRTTTRFAVRFVENLEPDLRGRKAPETDLLVADACRQRPGVFAELPLEGRKPNGLVIQVNSKGSRAFPKGQFRATQRDGVVYVKFAG